MSENLNHPTVERLARRPLPVRQPLPAAARATFVNTRQPLTAVEEARRNRAILSAIPDMMFTFDHEGRYLSFTAAKGMHPLVPPEQFLGHFIAEIMPADTAREAVRVIQAALETQEPQTFEYTLIENGEARLYEARCVAIGRDEVLGIVRDKTAQLYLRQEEQRRRDIEAIEERAEERMGAENEYMLSFREFTVLDLVADGLADKEIADKLGVSTFTVNKHVSNILTKMGAVSRTEAAVRAQREGLLGHSHLAA